MIITIHGDNGSGKSTLAKRLATYFGFPHFSTGDFARKLALDHGFTSVKDFMREMRKKDATFDMDDIIDGELKNQLALHANLVVDSRLGYHFAPNSIKIYCIIPAGTAARWIWDGDKDGRLAENFSDVEELKNDLIDRKELDREAYHKKYGTDYTDTTHFDGVIMSAMFENRPEEMLREALILIGEINAKKDMPPITIS
jgi:cytidylate kinase